MHFKLDTVLSLQPPHLILSPPFEYNLFIPIRATCPAYLKFAVLLLLESYTPLGIALYHMVSCSLSHPTQIKTVYHPSCFQASAIYVFFPLEYDTTANCNIPGCCLLTVLFPVYCGRCTRQKLRLCRVTKTDVCSSDTIVKSEGLCPDILVCLGCLRCSVTAQSVLIIIANKMHYFSTLFW